MNIQQQLARAISIASKVHEDQLDKGGAPYILHPLTLMNQLLGDYQLATIAVLHDVIEDSKGKVTIESLRTDGFSLRVLNALDLLTHRKSTDYLEHYITNICSNIDAIQVKQKDLEHNTKITRLKFIKPKDLERLEKYHKAYVLLEKAKNSFKDEC